MLKITPFIMYNDQLDAALKFYVSIFRNSKIVNGRMSGILGIIFQGAARPTRPWGALTDRNRPMCRFCRPLFDVYIERGYTPGGRQPKTPLLTNNY